MASLQGTTQAYQALAGTYLNLAPSCGDKLFGSNIDYCDLVTWGIYDGQENDPKVLKSYLNQTNSKIKSVWQTGEDAIKDAYGEPVSYSLSPANTKTTVYGLLSQLPQLSTMKKVIERSGWDSYLNSANDIYKVTLFAPNNQAFENSIYAQMPFENWNKNNLRVLGQAHTLPFTFEQGQAIDRKLRLYTALNGFSVYIDGTGEVSNKLNFYIPPDKMLNLRYPNPMKRINVVQAYYTNNGALYEIDGIFDPEVILY